MTVLPPTPDLMRLSKTRLALVAAVSAASTGSAMAQQDDSNWTFFGDTRMRAEFNDVEMGSDRQHPCCSDEPPKES